MLWNQHGAAAAGGVTETEIYRINHVHCEKAAQRSRRSGLSRALHCKQGIRAAARSESLTVATGIRNWMRRLATMAAASHALRLGPVALRPAQVALETPLSVVIRDLRPVLPGHVVVAPKRPVERYADLTEEEGDDLAVAIRHAQQLTPAADAFNVALKDGASAGQPVAHVHAHVVPCAEINQ